MALGPRGHPGASAASRAAKERQLERVPARPQRLAGSPAWERAKRAKLVKLGNAQVLELTFTSC